ncbi:zinc-ribbon and DUF3426 domain-containing protein [Spongorhabdus nitratireducens]
MTEPRVTRCPFCHTAFRVTPKQLEAASGSVRCGSCRQVFSALKNMAVTPAAKAPTSQPSKTQSAPLEDDVITASREESTPPKQGKPPKPAPDTSLLDDIAASNIPSLTPVKPPFFRSTAFWIVGTTLSLLILAGQYLWFNSYSLARKNQLWPVLQVFCEVTRCSLPARVDLNALRVDQLLVRSHPDQDDTLRVDAIIYNDADFSQPFPRLGLVFSDLQGNVIASRIFNPEAYLEGEAARLQQMEPHQPVRLALDIVDPGENAVSYHLSFLESTGSQ